MASSWRFVYRIQKFSVIFKAFQEEIIYVLNIYVLNTERILDLEQLAFAIWLKTHNDRRHILQKIQ